jgi:PKD repeat protein
MRTGLSVRCIQNDTNKLTPNNNFSVSSQLALVNTPVTFTDNSTNNPTSWKWYFGDGDSSMLQNPIHSYPYPGLFDVTLIVANNSGSETLIKPQHIKINNPPGIFPVYDIVVMDMTPLRLDRKYG